MPGKKHLKRTSRQKRIIKEISSLNVISDTFDESSPEGIEAAIVRQYYQIQKGYSRLMGDIVKELNLVKDWISFQALIKRDDIKARLSARLSRN